VNLIRRLDETTIAPTFIGGRGVPRLSTTGAAYEGAISKLTDRLGASGNGRASFHGTI